MFVPSATLAKAAGAIVGIGAVVLLVLWARSTYTIEGRIEADLGTHRTPARNIEVRLIERVAEDDMTNFVAEYEAFANEWPQAAASQLFVRALERITTRGTSTSAPSSLRDVGALKTMGDGGSDADAQAREFKANAQACREMKAACPIGGAFYDQGAKFWERKAAEVKESGGVTYTTRWVAAGGLGGEPVQIVSVVATGDKSSRPRAPTAKTAPTAPACAGGIVPGSSLSSNEVRAAAAEYEQALKQEHARLLRNADETLLSLTLAQTKTDEDGRYVFSGDVIQPGHYLVFTRYSAYSTENEPVDFMWFQQVDVTLRRFAFSRKIVVDLSNDNQRRPPVLDVKIATTNDLFIALTDRLRQHNLAHPPSP